MEAKPKRQLTPEQLEKLKLAREKAFQVRIQNKELKEFERQKAKEDKHYEKNKEKIDKEKKREEAVNIILETKKKAEPVKEQPKAKPEPKPKPEPEPEEESEEEIEYEPPPKKVIVKAPLPPPKQIIRKKAPQKPPPQPTEEDLYSNANIEMLRKKLRQQTLQRLNSDLFSY
jgi:hypothetical protein